MPAAQRQRGSTVLTRPGRSRRARRPVGRYRAEDSMDRKTRRRVALGAVCAAGLALPIAVAWPSLAAQTSTAPRAPAAPVANRAAQAVSVSSVSALTTAIANAVPGDTISLAAGKYSGGTIKI